MDWHTLIETLCLKPGLSDIFVRDDGEVSAKINKRRSLVTRFDGKQPFEDLLGLLFPVGAPVPGLNSLEPGATIGPRRFRLSYGRHIHGFELTLRYLDDHIRTPEEALIPKAVLDVWMQLPPGLIIVAGEMGSGKTNTVATLSLHYGMKNQKRIVSIEDPVELEYPRLDDDQSEFLQLEVGRSCASFSEASREMRRKSADMVIISEIRDQETAETALRLSQAGLRVVVTIHAVNAPTAIESFITELPMGRRDWGLVSLAQSFRMGICQRLYENPEDNRLYPIHEVFWNLRQHTGIAATIKKGDYRGIYTAMDSYRGEGMQTFRLALESRVRAGVLPRTLLQDPDFLEKP